MEFFFEKTREITERFKMYFACYHQGSHIRRNEQFFCILKLDFIDILRNGAIHMFFKKSCESWVTIGQILP